MEEEKKEKQEEFKVIAREAKVILTDCQCSKCGKGIMMRTGRKSMGKIDKTKVFFEHRCNKCKKVQNFANIQFPKVEFIPIDEYVKMMNRQKEEKEKNKKSENKPKIELVK